MSKNILITGGAGFVGSNLAFYLKDNLDDNHIICIDNLIRQGSEINASRLKDSGIEFAQMDVREKKALLGLPKIDLIIECSAEPSVLAAYEDPQYTIDTNLIGAVNCMELAKRDKAGTIFLSTNRVYPINELNNIPFEEAGTRYDWLKGVRSLGSSYDGITEKFPLTGVRSLYGASKLCAEHIILEFLDMYDLKGVINRFGIIAGPWQMGKIDQGLVGFWVAKHKFEGNLSYIGYEGTGKQVRDAVHVDDLCDLVMMQIRGLEKISGMIFNAGGGRKNSFSLMELTDIVNKITKKKIPIKSVLEERRADLRIYMTDNSRIEAETGWSPKKNLEDIIVDIDRWISDNETILIDILK